MSKAAAIYTAVMMQLADDGHDKLTLGSTLAQHDKPGPDGKPCYDASTVRTFLAEVALRLRGDTPSYIFKWTTLEPKVCTTSKLFGLVAEIGEATTVSAPLESTSSARSADP